MSNQADLDEDIAISQNAPSIMLPPTAPEAIMLLLVISVSLTTMLHTASLTHILGILILVLVAKINTITFNPYALNLLAKIHCIRDVTETCQQATQAHLTGLGREILSWISGVGPQESVFSTAGGFTETGQQFKHRAGSIGALASFVLVYKIVNTLYAKAYSIAKASTSIAELEVISASGQLQEEKPSIKSAGKLEGASHSNPLISPEDVDKELEAMPHANPLKIPEDKTPTKAACCTGCEALETAQEEWIEAVREYGDASETVLEENNGLKEQVKMLRQEFSVLREELRTNYDRTEYLDVLLEEAGKQLGHDDDVKDVLWEAYRRRRVITSTIDSSEAAETDDGS